ncbi:mechanosensitive channel MscK [Pseudomonas sp. MAP12]|uniref:Mechanosensitive channel MscK n=1 Tax=Geopseudomonas aromaticivorans TaxID=2849492 RepID=A0ABS6MXM4_9GAMM|nr:mechanosensitive channel MscK [Pseudomonas aromaticivorans]MBV2133563.1 mechanosensitive channel MscK [Pseudomonas aromaticivorans]
MMFKLRPFLASLLLGLLILAPFAGAADALPSAATVQKQLDALEARKLPEAEHKALQDTLQQTLDHLQTLKGSSAELASLKQQLAAAPKQTLEAQRELAQLKPLVAEELGKRYASLPTAQLEGMLGERLTQLNDWQAQLAQATNALINAQTRPERAQAEISANQTRAQLIREKLKSGKDNNQPLGPEQLTLLQSELAALEAVSLLRREELAGTTALQDLSASQRALLTQRIARLEAEILALQNSLNTKRREESAETVAQLSRESIDNQRGSLLATQADLNLALSDYLLKSTDRANELIRKNIETKQQLDSITQAEQALDEQIDVLKGSLLLTRILYQQKNALPKVSVDKNLADEIADLRLYQFELNQRRAEIVNPTQYVANLLAGQPDASVTPDLRSQLEQLTRARLALLDRLNTELGNLLTQAITLQLNQKQLLATSASLSRTLDEQMFWIASNKPLDLEWFKEVPGRLQRQLDALPIQDSATAIGHGLIGQPLLFLPLVVLLAALLTGRPWLRRQLARIDDEVDHLHRYRQLLTPLAVLYHFLLVLPLPLIVAACGLVLIKDPQAGTTIFGESLLKLAQALSVFGVSYRLLARGSVIERHFGWDPARVQSLYRQVRQLGLVVMPMVLVVSIAQRQLSGLAEDVLGIFIVLSGFLLMSGILLRIMRSQPPFFGSRVLHFIAALLLVGLPLAHVLLVGFGYYYTALKLTGRLLDSLYIIAIWTVVQSMVLHGLDIAARRLALQRAHARRQQPAREGADGELIEEPTLALEQVNQQSMRLVRLGLLLGFVGIFYFVWADLLAVFTYLDSVDLYEYTSGSGDTAVRVPISLSDLIGALVILVITLILARNLPGLLEMLVLSRLNLAQGSAYATTALLSYAIMAFGLVSTLSTLGLSWDKLQWLVAALSVGIGFGMQEIFANFISGLIILFERPVRIGDVVTIGNLSGSVSKIRIRATTIVDFDRKEIIVPNKTFITSQLVNWSLSDTVTRVTIKIGVAYGSDLDLVRRLLLEIARNNPRVLKEPEPTVLFLTFNESTLDHELRIHVRELGDRNAAVDEINREIDRLFREHDIDIAFRQLDVLVKNLQGQHLQLVNEQALPPSDASKAAKA